MVEGVPKSRGRTAEGSSTEGSFDLRTSNSTILLNLYRIRMMKKNSSFYKLITLVQHAKAGGKKKTPDLGS